jgi:hypothetical protein
MNAVIAPVTPASPIIITEINKLHLPGKGQPLGGGFFVDLYRHGDQTRALIVAPKAEGQFADAVLSESYDNVPGALSFVDGLANTDAFAAAGSELCQQIRALRIGGADDWHLPALEQLDLAYRALKPTDDSNYCTSGANLSAIPPAQRYSRTEPPQTTLAAFQKGGSEAFDPRWHWTSTEYAGNPDYAWIQSFANGGQDCFGKDDGCLARAFRSILVI